VNGGLQVEEPFLHWQYVPVADYKPPGGMVVDSVKGGMLGLWQRLTASKKGKNTSIANAEKLKSLPDALLNVAVPAPEWGSALSPLHHALTPWHKKKSHDDPAIFIISPPHGGNARILAQYARARGLSIIPTPTPKQILMADELWFETFAANNRSPWVLPALEQCYLRHVSGLSLMRRFFERLFSGALNRGIIGCDSWAWAYLKHAMKLNRTNALAAQSFDQQRLSFWFGELARRATGKSPAFLQSDDGSQVLHPEGETKTPNGGKEVADFLKKLAAYSRGIPGVAWTLWRQSLNTLPDANYDSEKEAAPHDKGEKTLWVTPWDKMCLTAPPLPLEEIQVLVMHVLLLHNGLHRSLLYHMLPFQAHELNQALILLEGLGILERNQKKWHVSAAAYPAVRRAMGDEGYLTDEF
jgi:hypothetical protein